MGKADTFGHFENFQTERLRRQTDEVRGTKTSQMFPSTNDTKRQG